MANTTIFKQIRRHEKILRRDFKVQALYVFGSFARGTASRKSDVDILVDFSASDIGLFEFIRLQKYLESILKRSVDLVTRDAIKDWMKAEVERTAIRAA